MHRLPCALLALAVTLPATADGPLAWKVEPQHFLRWKIVRLKAQQGEQLARLGFSHWGALWHELDPTGDRWWPVTRRARVPLALALLLPDREVPPGGEYSVARAIDSITDVGRFKVTGGGSPGLPATFLSLPCRAIRLRMAFAPAEAEREGKSYKMAGGGLEGTIYWHAGRGHVLGGTLHCWMRLAHRKPPAKGPAEIVERYRFRFEIDLVLPLKDTRLDRMVNQSIARGVAWLKKKQNKDGAWGDYGGAHHLGYNSLVLLALLASGVAADDPVVVKAFDYLARQKIERTYDAALYLMAIEARVAPAPEALRAMSQAERRKALAAMPKKIARADRLRLLQAARFLLGDESYKKRWGYPHKKGTTHPYDNSNSQYGVLGLLSAERCGLRLSGALWTNIARFWLAEQDTTGPQVDVKRRERKGPREYVFVVPAKARGWNYRRPSRGSGGSYGSMTCAGVASLAICRSRLWQAGLLDRKLATRLDEGVRDGLAWLQQHYDLRRNPQNGGWFYYYLYGLERAGELSGERWIGEHDWYREGAALLVDWQRGGAWSNSPLDTAYALLFLKRATAPVTYSRAR